MAVLDRVPMADIAAQARALSFVRAVLTLVTGILYAVGWTVAKVCAGVWFVVRWCFAAAMIGWRDARGGG